MATFYLDLVGGNDANDGTSFANRWLTVTNGATAARIAPGDTIRVMKSPDPTLLDSSASWTNNSINVTLSGAVTANVDTCESAWTASANVTSTVTSTSNKEGTNCLNLVVAAGFTTGKIAYVTLASTDFSAYQQLSFWIKLTAAAAAGVLELRLCSDTTGDVTVDSFPIPAIANTNDWHPFTVNKGSALGAAIQSVALYATVDPGATTINLDNIIACKAVDSADSLTLCSLIGKVHNLYWASGASYSQNDKRKPTPPNRTGFTYKVQNVGGGTSGGSEPTWPQYIGGTVVDNGITWVCEELEDTWYGIQSINGTAVKLDADTDLDAGSGRGYPHDTESVATYKLEPIPLTPAIAGSAAANTINDSGTATARIVFTGGWNTTDMSTQTGETWQDFKTAGSGWILTSKSFVTVDNCSGVRAATGFNLASSCTNAILLNSHYNNCDNAIGSGIGCNLTEIKQGTYVCNGSSNLNLSNSNLLSRIASHSSQNNGVITSSTNATTVEANVVHCKNNTTFGFNLQDLGSTHILRNVITSNNASGAINRQDGDVYLYDCLLQESTEVATQNVRMNRRAFSHNHDQVLGAHKIFTDGATVATATDQRNTGSGYSWKFSLTSTNRGSEYPVDLVVLPLLCKANTTHNVRIYTRRDNTNIKGVLLLRGGSIAGVPSDVSVTCEPTINTWVQSSALTFTPTVAGVVQIIFRVYDGVGTTNNYWVDDVSVS